jgi:PilZ domain
MDQNRRRHLRNMPDSFTFIQIERDEIGKVLNVSEGGLSFCSFAPVPRNLPLYFWLSFNLKDRIEAMGEVTWTDATRKIGGLRFTHLTPNGQQQIQKWLARLRSVQVTSESLSPTVGEPVQQFARMDERVKVGKNGSNEPDRVARFVAKARVRVAPFVPAAERPEDTEISHVSTLLLDSARRTEPAPKIGPFRGSESTRANARRTMLATEVADPEDARVAPFPPAPMFAKDVAETKEEKVAPLPPEPRTEAAPRIEPPKARGYRPIFSFDGGDSGESKIFSLPMRGIESLVELVPLQRHLSAKKQQLILGVLLGMCVSAAVAASALKYRSYYREGAHNTGSATVAADPKNDVKAQAPAPGPAPRIPSVAGSAAGDIFSEGRPYRAPAAKFTSSKEIAANYSYGQPRSYAAGSRTAKPPARASDPLQFSENPAPSKKQMTPQQLWTAVQGGSSKAAVELAELYIKGQDVPQNCQQARVLLLMASEKRSAVAIKRLQQLDKDSATCP